MTEFYLSEEKPLFENRPMWFNFDTDQYDYGPEDGNYAPYLPNKPTTAARDMYQLLVEDFGKDPKLAAAYVLERVVGVPSDKRPKIDL